MARNTLVLAALASLACAGPDDSEPGPVAADRVAPAGRTIRLGDIDSDTPARRTRRLQPLADYLARELVDLGFGRGRVVIARDIDEMAQLLVQGEVDIYLDSVFPSLAVRERTGSRFVLRRWAQGAADYSSLFVTARDSGIESLEALRGGVLALQEEYSTSGFLLPAGTLASMGFELRRVGGPTERNPGVISYVFTYDEENTVELVSTGRAAAGAISNQEYEQMTPSLRDGLRVLAETATVPRQVLSVRAELEPAVVDRVADVLLALTGPDGDPVALEDSDGAWTWKFDQLDPGCVASIDELRALAELLGVL